MPKVIYPKKWKGTALVLYDEDKEPKEGTYNVGEKTYGRNGMAFLCEPDGYMLCISDIIGFSGNESPRILNDDIVIWHSCHGLMATDGKTIQRFNEGFFDNIE